MNYFAHGRRYVQDAWFLAGTAVPDWLNVVHRRVRARSRTAQEYVGHEDGRLAAIARGIVQHHHDDGWFHQTRAFAELNWRFTVGVRDRLPADDGFRPSFVGHILVELLLDAELIQDHVGQLDAYYAAVDGLDPQAVTTAVQTITGHDVGLLTPLITRFSAERFLYDYLDDAKLLTRLNHVMRRVQLPPLPDELTEFLASARYQVRARKAELLSGET